MDIIIFSEIWFKDNFVFLEYVFVFGYLVVFRNWEFIKGGGVGVYIYELINFKCCIDIEKCFFDLEYLWLEVFGCNRYSKVFIGIMYRFICILSDIDWLEWMDVFLGNIMVNWDGLLVVMGDVNIDMLKLSNILIWKY